MRNEKKKSARTLQQMGGTFDNSVPAVGAGPSSYNSNISRGVNAIVTFLTNPRLRIIEPITT